MSREFFEIHLRIPKPWRWLRLRISTLLLLVAIVAIALAWHRDHNRLQSKLDQIRRPQPNWGAEQAAGPPDTMQAGDHRTAWASRTQDGQAEWLIADYDHSVVPIAVAVHETYNPGAVVKATAFDFWGIEHDLWEGPDPTPVGAKRGTSRLKAVANAIKTCRIKLYIDSPAVPSWNEIDAVGLVYLDDAGAEQTLWANEVTASSSYGDDVHRSGQSSRGITYVY